MNGAAMAQPVKYTRIKSDGKTYVLLSDWTKQHGLNLVNTKTSARRGRLRHFVKAIPVGMRLFIEEDTPNPYVPAKETEKAG